MQIYADSITFYISTTWTFIDYQSCISNSDSAKLSYLKMFLWLGQVFKFWCFLNTMDTEEIVSLFRSPMLS